MVKSFKEFIKEGQVDLHNLKLGDKVAHAKHGIGKVVVAPLKTPDVHVQFKSGTKHFHRGNAHELTEYYGHSMYEATFKIGDKVKHGERTAHVTHTDIPNRNVNIEYHDNGQRLAIDRKHLKRVKEDY